MTESHEPAHLRVEGSFTGPLRRAAFAVGALRLPEIDSVPADAGAGPHLWEGDQA